jgi:hypothetical protein
MVADGAQSGLVMRWLAGVTTHMLQCPTCLKVNADDALRCQQCGINIQAMLRLRQSAGPPQSPAPQAPVEEPVRNMPLRVGWLLMVGGYFVSKFTAQQAAQSKWDYGTDAPDYSALVVIGWLVLAAGIGATFIGISRHFKKPK